MKPHLVHDESTVHHHPKHELRNSGARMQACINTDSRINQLKLF